jgi:hypothetical protein
MRTAAAWPRLQDYCQILAANLCSRHGKLGIKEGDESAGLALVELGRRLGAALARTNDKVIEHGEKPAPLSAPRADDDRVVEIIEC